MVIVNILSVVGLMLASFLSYERMYLGSAGPSHFPFFVTNIMLAVFAISYILSLMNVTGSLAKLFALLAVALGFLINIVFVVLILSGKGSYPHLFHMPACYIQAALLLVLVVMWNKKK